MNISTNTLPKIPQKDLTPLERENLDKYMKVCIIICPPGTGCGYQKIWSEKGLPWPGIEIQFDYRPKLKVTFKTGLPKKLKIYRQGQYKFGFDGTKVRELVRTLHDCQEMREGLTRHREGKAESKSTESSKSLSKQMALTIRTDFHKPLPPIQFALENDSPLRENLYRFTAARIPYDPEKDSVTKK